MTIGEWESIKSLLYEALQMPSERRSAFLDQACASRPALRAEVESILAAEEQVRSSFLESPPLDREPIGGIEFAAPLEHGQIIAQRFRLLRLLGEGGMGQVWLADQLSPVCRQVAIKFIRAGMYDASIARRFQSERQSLAIMDHPAIAKVFEAGATEQGQPFFVMEYVAGLPITDYCDQRKLTIPQRLALFIQACEGVQHAHQKAILHRDLKPANILVVEVDGKPQPRIIDFGLAKAAATIDGESSVTQLGSIVGTPGYMSPEQADLSDHKIDARTDVYSLGATLYVLLSGALPLDLSTRNQPLAEMLRRLREEEPALPSVKAGSVRSTSSVTASNRGMVPAQLVSRLRGDLDRIAMKALEKDPSRRYASPGELAADCERHLRRVPIMARKATMLYRTNRFLNRHRESSAAVAVILSAILILCLSGYLLFRRPGTKLTERDTIVLADFENRTGDSVFNDTMKQALAVELGQSPFLNILSDARVSAALRMMGRAPTEPVSPSLGREVCQRTQSKAVLSGMISGLGSRYLIDLNAVACSTGETLAREHVEADRKENVLKALSRASSEIRSKLGESLPSVKKFDVSIEETTRSLDALRAFSLALNAERTKGGASSIPLYQRAIELDPEFPMAYANLGNVYYDAGEESRGADYMRKAFQLRDRVSERERFFIESRYYSIVTGEIEKANAIYEAWAQVYPLAPMPHHNWSSNLAALGQFERAAAESNYALRLVPRGSPNPDYSASEQWLTALDRTGEAKSLYQAAQQQHIDDAGLHWNRYGIAFLENDYDEMQRQLRWASGKPGVEDILLLFQSDTEAFHGRWRVAERYLAQALASDRRNDLKETAALIDVCGALRSAEFGFLADARVRVRRGLAAAANNRDVQILSAMTFARIGDRHEAQLLSEKLDRAYPLDTLIQGYWLPAIRAALDLRKHDPQSALALLEASKPYELGLQDTWFEEGAPIYPAFLRGEAYLMLHDGTGALAEFQKYSQHRGLVENCYLGALAQIGIARAYALLGDRANARAGYEAFFSVWKDADSAIPVLRQARKEYAHSFKESRERANPGTL